MPTLTVHRTNADTLTVELEGQTFRLVPTLRRWAAWAADPDLFLGMADTEGEAWRLAHAHARFVSALERAVGDSR